MKRHDKQAPITTDRTQSTDPDTLPPSLRAKSDQGAGGLIPDEIAQLRRPLERTASPGPPALSSPLQRLTTSRRTLLRTGLALSPAVLAGISWTPWRSVRGNGKSGVSDRKETMMKDYRVTGGGGVQLHVVEAGNPRGRPILFIHGLSQSSLTWSRQMRSDLANDYRLVAMDLRGHGLSEKPREGYGDSRLWADDVSAVIGALSLDHPVLCGWSYGPLVILDYIRHHGENDIGGVNFVDGITKLGSDEALAVIAPEVLGLVPGLFATDVEESVRSLTSFLRMFFAQEPSADELYLMLGYNVSVPAYVRQALFSRSLDNDDILPKLRKPVLLTHGAKDAVVNPAVVDQHKAGVRHAQVHVMANAGHAPFWDDAATFNQHLRALCDSL